jgi:hypothetical protein
MPGVGPVGGIVPEPADPRALAGADPFAPGSGVTVLETYGVNWARWETYDLGCGGQIRNPQASTDTGVGNALLFVPVMGSALTASLARYAYQPSSWLSKLDPAVIAVTTGLGRAVTTPLAPLALIVAGTVLIWTSRRLRLAAAATSVLGVVAALGVLYLVAGAPVRAGAVADTVMGTAATAINTAINRPADDPGGGTGGGSGAGVPDPGTDAVAPFVDHVLYTHWLAGQVGSSTSPTAVRYGPVLFRAKAVSFAEAAAVKGDADATRDLYETKQKSWTETRTRSRTRTPTPTPTSPANAPTAPAKPYRPWPGPTPWPSRCSRSRS